MRLLFAIPILAVAVLFTARTLTVRIGKDAPASVAPNAMAPSPDANHWAPTDLCDKGTHLKFGDNGSITCVPDDDLDLNKASRYNHMPPCRTYQGWAMPCEDVV